MSALSSIPSIRIYWRIIKTWWRRSATPLNRSTFTNISSKVPSPLLSVEDQNKLNWKHNREAEEGPAWNRIKAYPRNQDQPWLRLCLEWEGVGEEQEGTQVEEWDDQGVKIKNAIVIEGVVLWAGQQGREEGTVLALQSLRWQLEALDHFKTQKIIGQIIQSRAAIFFKQKVTPFLSFR